MVWVCTSSQMVVLSKGHGKMIAWFMEKLLTPIVALFTQDHFKIIESMVKG